LLGNGKPGSTCTWKKKNISFNDGGMFVPNFGASNDLRPIKILMALTVDSEQLELYYSNVLQLNLATPCGESCS
jgi:hypothetical protein